MSEKNLKQQMNDLMTKAMEAEPRTKEAWEATCDFMSLMHKTNINSSNPGAIDKINYCAVSAISTMFYLLGTKRVDVQDPLAVVEYIIRVALVAYEPHLTNFAVNSDVGEVVQ